MSNTSEHIGQLALSLSKAQGMITGALKDSANPFFKSKYADISSVWDACRAALSQHELAVVQTTSGDVSNITVITTLIHSSGEWISGSLTIKPSKPDAQGVGSVITYARRYGLSAIVGISQIDDDGNSASKVAVSNSSGVDVFGRLKTSINLDELKDRFASGMETLKSTHADDSTIRKFVNLKEELKETL